MNDAYESDLFSEVHKTVSAYEVCILDWAKQREQPVQSDSRTNDPYESILLNESSTLKLNQCSDSWMTESYKMLIKKLTAQPVWLLQVCSF